jgi:hypothetical protein
LIEMRAVLASTLTLLLATSALTGVFPSTSKASWMSPDAFHLAIGMPRAKVERLIASNALKSEPGKLKDDLVILYDEGKTVTLTFERNRIRAIRFELVSFLPDLRAGFEEQKTLLVSRYGQPHQTKSAGTVMIWDHIVPNVFAVLSVSRNTPAGKQGVGFLIIRYVRP